MGMDVEELVRGVPEDLVGWKLEEYLSVCTQGEGFNA